MNRLRLVGGRVIPRGRKRQPHLFAQSHPCPKWVIRVDFGATGAGPLTG